MIDADVTELIARVPLPAGADMLEVVLRELERIFLEDSGLAEGRPGVRVSVSRPAHYLELLENIQVHGYHVMRGRGRVLENAEIAADWYDAIYTPTLAAIDRLQPRPPLPGRAARGSVPRSPPAPAGCVPLDRLPAPRADRRLSDRRTPAAPPAAVAAAREPLVGLALAQRLKGTSECLAAGEHRLEEVAVLLDSLERLAHPEAARRHVLGQLIPAERRRDRRARLRPHRVDRGDRLPPRVLAVVDEHALALVLQPFGRDEPGCRSSSPRATRSAKS